LAYSNHKEPSLLALGQAVKLMRAQAGMNVDELAKASGVPHERITALEAGHIDPTYEQLLEIADGLGVQPSALVSLAERLRKSADR
jgi:transcriptional regulator with XRE-family HTH domain